MAAPDFKSAATLIPKVLCSAQVATTTEVAMYTVPVGVGVQVSHGTLANISGGAVTIGLGIVPAAPSGTGGTTSAGDGTHKLIPDSYSLGAGDTLSLKDYLDGAMLGPGDAVWCHAGTANAIDLVLTGVTAV